tara:strand:- start:264 stop:386 length:123 start_codon:yes stop_codon:yes gene_type:complete
VSVILHQVNQTQLVAVAAVLQPQAEQVAGQKQVEQEQQLK